MIMAADILNQIVSYKKQEIEAARSRRPEASLREEIATIRQTRSLFNRLSNRDPQDINIIAEIKRASPSKGLIRPDLDPAVYAREYERGGAAALSVLTDRHFFKGSAEDLKTAHRESSLPVLRKDFIVSAYQIYETAAIGADAMLLIAAILSRKQLQDYLALCRELNLDALVEVHTEDEYQKATRAGAKLIGINNRNLKTFHTDIGTCISLAARLSDDQVGVAESGIRTPADIDAVRCAGIGNFLIGESLVRADNPRLFLQALVSGQGLLDLGRGPADYQTMTFLTADVAARMFRVLLPGAEESKPELECGLALFNFQDGTGVTPYGYAARTHQANIMGRIELDLKKELMLNKIKMFLQLYLMNYQLIHQE